MNSNTLKDFKPSISHPLYFIRKGLYDGIAGHSKQLTGRLLDFGCGAKPYQHLFNHVSAYIGVDYNSEGHTHENESIDFYYDGRTLPFKNEEFDSIFSSEVFEHVFNLAEILPEINRVMKKGGKILFTCPFSWEEHEIPIDYARYTRFALEDLLQKSGFRIVSFQKSGDFLTTLHQQFVIYINDFWLHRVFFFSRFGIFKKMVRQILVPLLNGVFYLFRGLWPKSDKLYLNNICLAEKI